MNLPLEVIEAARDGRCVLFLGSAASREAAEEADRDYPEERALAKALGWRPPKQLPGVRPKPVVPSVLEGAGLCEAQRGRAGLLATLNATVGGADLPPSKAMIAAAERFPLVFTTAWDGLIHRAAPDHQPQFWGDPVPEMPPDTPVIYALRGLLSRPETVVATAADRAARPFSTELKVGLRNLVRRQVIFFMGFRPDEEEFEQLWEDLTVCYGGELPRCHLAVAQGPINDYQWQRWVWRGLLLFSADPSECMEALDAALEGE